MLVLQNMSKTIDYCIHLYLCSTNRRYGTGTVTVGTGTDAAGNVVTSTPTSGATFTVDNTAPTLSSVSIASNNSTTTLAKASNVVTLTFTASETIATPVVTFQSRKCSDYKYFNYIRKYIWKHMDSSLYSTCFRYRWICNIQYCI